MNFAEGLIEPPCIYCRAQGGLVFGTEGAGVTWSDLPLPDRVFGVYATVCA